MGEKIKEFRIHSILTKDIKELNTVVLSFACIIFLITCGIISYSINSSHALFSNVINGEKLIELSLEEDVFIRKIKCINQNDTYSNIKSINGTKINNIISLSTTDLNSYITCDISLYNSSKDQHYFYKIEEINYDNENITYELIDLSHGDIIKSGEIKNFKIKYHYKNSLKTNNKLESELNFKFDTKRNELTFDTNTAEVLFSNNSRTNNIIYNSNNEIIKGKYEEPTRANYSFVDWNDKSDGTGEVYNYGITNYVIDKTLYAQWYQHRDVPITFVYGSYATNTLPLYGNSRIVEGKKKLDASVNADKAKYFEFDIYIEESQRSNLNAVKNHLKTVRIDSQVELTSSGKYDVDEMSWSLNEVVPNLEIGTNHVVLNLKNASKIGSINLSQMNYFRMYTNTLVTNTTMSELVVIVNNFKFK